MAGTSAAASAAADFRLTAAPHVPADGAGARGMTGVGGATVATVAAAIATAALDRKTLGAVAGATMGPRA